MGEREGGMSQDTRLDVNTLPCVKEIASGSLQYSSGSSAQHSMKIQWGGRDTQEGVDTCIRVQQKLT